MQRFNILVVVVVLALVALWPRTETSTITTSSEHATVEARHPYLHRSGDWSIEFFGPIRRDFLDGQSPHILALEDLHGFSVRVQDLDQAALEDFQREIQQAEQWIKVAGVPALRESRSLATDHSVRLLEQVKLVSGKTSYTLRSNLEGGSLQALERRSEAFRSSFELH